MSRPHVWPEPGEMSEAPCSRLSPWIESLILSYSAQAEQDGGGGGGAWLKAHVIRVGQMSASQAQSADGPTGLLFLSDGAVQMPGVLTAAAWERLQEQEERECFTSLLNTTVCIRDSQLLFHMAPEQTGCQFYLLVGELATAAAGPVKDSPPCCTTLPAVRTKICGTWRTLLGRADSQPSQHGLNLSELLGVWQHDCLQAVLDDVGRSLAAAAAAGERPSTSTATPQCRLTGWDQDRIRYKTEEPFSVPVSRLLILEDGMLPSVDEPEWRINEPPTAGRVCDRSEGVCDRSEGVCDRSESPASPVGDDTLRDLVVTGAGVIDCPLSNPWDMFPPPCVSSHSSSDTTPPPLTDAVAAESRLDPVESRPNPTESGPDSESRPDPAAAPTGTLLHGSKASSLLPPYQKPLGALTAASSTSESPPASDRQQGAPKRPRRKRKQSEDSAEDLASLQEGEEQEEEPSGSPPSWLFTSEGGGLGPDGDGSPTQTTTGNTPTAPGTHSDGTPFSYSYAATGQDLQDLSRLSVARSLLQWAVNYLIAPKRAGGRHDAV